MNGETPLFLMPSSTPATPAMPEPIMKVTSTTRLTSTPSSAAVSWFSAVARMARPILVRSMKNHSTTISVMATPRMKSCTELMVIGPEVIELLLDRLRKRHLLAAEDIDREILQDDGEADRADQRRERAILGDRAHRDIDRDDAEQGAGDHRAQQRDIDVGTARRATR